MSPFLAACLAFAAPGAASAAPGEPPTAPAPSASATFSEKFAQPTRPDAPVSLGASFGGGSLVALTLDARLGAGLSAQLGAGLRVGVTARDVYPNVAVSAGVTGAWGVKPLRSGVYVSLGSSAPLSFWDAWISAGYALEVRDARGVRRGLLEVGPALYLVRELPTEVPLNAPAFLFARYTVLFALGRPARAD